MTTTYSNIILYEGGNSIFHRGKYVQCFDDNGKNLMEILTKYYNTTDKVKELLDLGTIAVLGPQVSPNAGTPHTFMQPQENVTVSYLRDFEGNDFGKAKSVYLDSFLEDIQQSRIAETVYLFLPDSQKWIYNPRNIADIEEALLDVRK